MPEAEEVRDVEVIQKLVWDRRTKWAKAEKDKFLEKGDGYVQHQQLSEKCWRQNLWHWWRRSKVKVFLACWHRHHRGFWRVGTILLECYVEQGYGKVFHEMGDTWGKWNWSCSLMLAVKILSPHEDRDCSSFQNQNLFRFQHIPLTDLHCLCGVL